MKVSVFTTVTDPYKRGDLFSQALDSYLGFADEVVVVDGSPIPDISAHSAVKIIPYYWPQEFDWPFIGAQFQRGYEAATGTWVIHADVDFIFHEQDYSAIRKAFQDNPDAPALSFWKFQFILPDRYNLKSRLVIAVNKGKYGDRIRFDSGGDGCQPSLDGIYIDPDSVPEARLPFYNYDFLAKTEAQIIDDISRMDRAYHREFGKYLYSVDGSEQSAYKGWLDMVIGRSQKPSKHIEMAEHPKVIQQTIKGLHSDQCGYSVFGNVSTCKYFVNNDKIEL